MTHIRSLVLSPQPGPDGCEPESGPVAPVCMVLAISVSDEHSCVEKLSVSPQAGTGQRGSGHVSQRGTKLRPYLSAQDPGSFANSLLVLGL